MLRIIDSLKFRFFGIFIFQKYLPFRIHLTSFCIVVTTCNNILEHEIPRSRCWQCCTFQCYSGLDLMTFLPFACASRFKRIAFFSTLNLTKYVRAISLYDNL